MTEGSMTEDSAVERAWASSEGKPDREQASRLRPRCRLLLSAVAVFLVLPGCAEEPDPEPAAETESGHVVGEALPEGAPGWLAELSPEAATEAPQAISLLGEELFAREDEDGRVAAVDRELARDPDDVELLIAAGRERRHVWQYRQAMELYTRAAERAPEDWRPYRFRGHRHISLREFEAAIDDLERARELAPMNWDVAYHLGLAHFLAGEFDAAADEYIRCLELAGEPEAARAGGDDDDFRSCAANQDDPESLVAMKEWTVRALMRAGRTAEAEEWLAALPDDLSIETNVAYHHNLLMNRGEMEPEELLDPGEDGPYRLETVGFGVANRWLAQGDTARAVELLERLMADEWWPGFGRIAAEAELARLGGSRR